jgi:hypothetical protein
MYGSAGPGRAGSCRQFRFQAKCLPQTIAEMVAPSQHWFITDDFLHSTPNLSHRSVGRVPGS